MGKISKTVQIHTNDPAAPVTILTLSMYVRDALHMKKYASQEIFNGRCRGCHVERGIGKKGVELFHDDCIMCHDRNRSAETLSDMRERSKKDVSEALRNGVQDTTMPGWEKAGGGPLGEEEIRSLVDFLFPAN